MGTHTCGRDLGVLGLTVFAIVLVIAQPLYGGLGVAAFALAVVGRRIWKSRRTILVELTKHN